MSYIPNDQSSDEERRLSQESTRDEVIARLNRKNFEVLVVGGGIIGASVARLAAFNGLRTALLEMNDYASGTSSRSSKMLHGGLRYLAMGDIRQVYEGLRSREQLLQAAPHLAKLTRFQIPIAKSDLKNRFVLGAGLKLYDFLARFGGGSAARSRWLTELHDLNPVIAESPAGLAGCYEFSDGIMDDTRLVLETIFSARQEGAVCLNYAKVMTVDSKVAGQVGVGWTDLVSGKSYESTTGIVINCAGPWAPHVGRISPGKHLGEIRYSRGSHILFDKPWPGSALLFPKAGGTNYFVWPHAYGTMVGTTEREVQGLDDDPIPTKDEIEEILERLAHDIPQAGLSKESAHYCFAGVRTLPAETRAGRTAKLSRRHRWLHHDGMLSLVGGKFTSAAWTAYQGMKIVYELAGIANPLVPIAERKFPGAGNLQSATEEFSQKCAHAGVSDHFQQAALRRFGSRANSMDQIDDWSESFGQLALRGEIELSARTEQVVYIEDLMRRRLGIEYAPGSGADIVATLSEILRGRICQKTADDAASYQARIARIRELLQ